MRKIHIATLRNSILRNGAPTPLVQVASITSPDPRTLFIKPWEKTIIQDIEKAIMNSELGLSPQNDGENIIINI